MNGSEEEKKKAEEKEKKKKEEEKESEKEDQKLGWLFKCLLFALAVIVVALIVSAIVFKGKGWDYCLLAGIVAMVLFALGFFFSCVRPKAKKLAEKITKLTKEENELLNCFQDLDKLENDYEKHQIAIEKVEKEAMEKGKLLTLKAGKEYQELVKLRDEKKQKFEEYKQKVIRPRKKDGKGLQIYDLAKDGEKGKYELRGLEKGEKTVGGMATMQREKRDLEKDLVLNGYVPFVVTIVSLALLLLFLIVSQVDKGADKGVVSQADVSQVDVSQVDVSLADKEDEKPSTDFGPLVWGPCSRGMVAILVVGFILYLTKSFPLVLQDERALKHFFGKPYGESGPGRPFAPWGLVKISALKTSEQYFNLKQDKAMLSGGQSQHIDLNLSGVWIIVDVWKVATYLGLRMEDITQKLTGKEGAKEKGLLGDFMQDVSRAYVADQRYIGTLDDALQMRKSLASRLRNDFNDTYGYLGVNIKVNITDVDPVEEMVKSRNEKAIAPVKVETAKIRVKEAFQEASAQVEKAKGAAKEKKLLGAAEANVKDKIGKAEAQALLYDLQRKAESIQYLTEKGVKSDIVQQLLAVLMLGDETVANVFKAAEGMKINLFAIPGIEDLLKKIGGKLGAAVTS